jgi:hypothetical protein
MHLHSPLRPKNSLGNLCLTSGTHIVPVLTFSPKYPAGWNLYINVPTIDGDVKQWAMAVTDPCHIEATLLLYENDPEEFLVSMCGMPREFTKEDLFTKLNTTTTQIGGFDTTKQLTPAKPKPIASEIEF